MLRLQQRKKSLMVKYRASIMCKKNSGYLEALTYNECNQQTSETMQRVSNSEIGRKTCKGFGVVPELPTS
jgi:hypothetical protein